MNQGVPLELMQMPPNEVHNFLLVAEREMVEIDNAWAYYDKVRSQPVKAKHQFLVWLAVFALTLPIWLFAGYIGEAIDAFNKWVDRTFPSIESLSSGFAIGVALFLFGLEILIFFIPIIAPFIVWGIYRSKAMKRKLAMHQQAVSDAEQNAMTVTNQHAKALLCVPEDYWHPSTLQIMINIMRTGRAANWSECAREYENEKHRLEMRSLSEESQTLQKKTLNAAKGAAVLSGLAAIFAAISASNNRR
jgi:hypothetical protein